MKHVRTHLLAAGLLALGLGASAQTPPPQAPGSASAPMAGQQAGRFDSARMQQHMQERMARRLAALKQKLQITPAQEGAWNTFTAALKPPVFRRPDRAEFEKLPTPERIDRMRALRAERMAEMDKRADATKTFYAALSPEQKKLFDEEFARFARRFGHRHGGHHMS